MRVSIITPSRNQGKYIGSCLESVHGQTHRDFEHIVIDGMSSDETEEVASRYPCTFLQLQDTGPAQAINRGLEMATGDIVCWLNADDAFWSNTVLARVVDLFSKIQGVDMISGNGYYINERGYYINPIVVDRPMRFRLKWIKRRDFILQPATFWLRNGLRLDESLTYCFDWKFWIECFEAGLNIIYIPEYLALYRIHSYSLTFQDTASRRGEIYHMVKTYTRDPALNVSNWVQWRMYQLSEAFRLPQIKQGTSLARKVISRLSDGFV